MPSLASLLRSVILKVGAAELNGQIYLEQHSLLLIHLINKIFSRPLAARTSPYYFHHCSMLSEVHHNVVRY